MISGNSFGPRRGRSRITRKHIEAGKRLRNKKCERMLTLGRALVVSAPRNAPERSGNAETKHRKLASSFLSDTADGANRFYKTYLFYLSYWFLKVPDESRLTKRGFPIRCPSRRNAGVAICFWQLSKASF